MMTGLLHHSSVAPSWWASPRRGVYGRASVAIDGGTARVLTARLAA